MDASSSKKTALARQNLKRIRWLLDHLRDHTSGPTFKTVEDELRAERALVALNVVAARLSGRGGDPDLLEAMKHYWQLAENACVKRSNAVAVATGGEVSGIRACPYPHALRNLCNSLSRHRNRLKDSIKRPGEGAKSAASAARPKAPPTPRSKEATALALLVDHPDWTTKRIADEAGCSRSLLEHSPKFRGARAAQKREPRKVQRDPRTGNLEAEDGGRER